MTNSLPRQLPPGIINALALLASELVTNAIRHGCHDEDDVVEIVLWLADGHCWLAVSDAGNGCHVPALSNPESDDETGRGLALVDHIATAWAVTSRATQGTSVVAGLPAHAGR